jgi:hypothetical protein
LYSWGGHLNLGQVFPVLHTNSSMVPQIRQGRFFHTLSNSLLINHSTTFHPTVWHTNLLQTLKQAKREIKRNKRFKLSVQNT